MIDLVYLSLNIVATVVILAVITILSWKKIVPYVLKKSLAGQLSGFNRNQKAVKKQIAKVMLDKTLVGPILDMVGLGDIKNYLAKHPDAMFTIAQVAGPYIEKFIDGIASGGVNLDTTIPLTQQPEVLSLVERIKKTGFG